MSINYLMERAAQVRAWFKNEPGPFTHKLHSILQGAIGERRGIKTATLILQSRQAALTTATADLQHPMAGTPPITRDNTLILVAAHINSEERCRVLLHNLRHLCQWSNHIRVYDLPHHLTPEFIQQLQSVRGDITAVPIQNDDMQDQTVLYESYPMDPQYDYCLLTTDSFCIINSLAPFFAMATTHMGQYNTFALDARKVGDKYWLCTDIRLYNRRSLEAAKRCYDILRPECLRQAEKIRHRHAAYQRFHRYGLMVHAIESGISPFLLGRAMVRPEEDDRINGYTAFYFKPDVFREYMEQHNYPIFKLRQLRRPEFAYLRQHIPTE